MRNPHETRTRSRAALIAVCIAAGIAAALFTFMYHGPKAAGGYLPKDVPQTPAASPLASAPPAPALHSDAVTIDLSQGSPVGPQTSVIGTANSPDGTVYYQISDFRRGQVAVGQVTVPSGSSQPFRFQPDFTRVYTKGDPATLDVYVLNGSGGEEVSRVTIKLQ